MRSGRLARCRRRWCSAWWRATVPRRHTRGRAALASWLAEPTSEAPQIRSIALLKLFFGQFASEGDIAALARAQLETQRRRLEVFKGLIERLEARGDRPWQLEVAELLHQAELTFASSWTRISELVEERSDTAGARG